MLANLVRFLAEAAFHPARQKAVATQEQHIQPGSGEPVNLLHCKHRLAGARAAAHGEPPVARQLI